MTHTLEQTLVRNILEHPADYPWKMQDIGLLALRLDERREYRLHVWDPESCVGDPPVHDHPFDFTSTVIVGSSSTPASSRTRAASSTGGIATGRATSTTGAPTRFAWWPP